MRDDHVREEICWVGRMLHHYGFVAAYDGNISVRLSQNTVLSTPTAMCKGMMDPEDLVLVDLQGEQLSGERRPSSELGMHLLFYRMRSDVLAVVHAHPPVATGFATAGIALDQPLVAEVVTTFGTIPLARYGTPGTPEVAAGLAPLLRDHDGILMANHGVVTCGSSLLNAYLKMEKIEHYAKVVAAARQLGPCQPLGNEEVGKLMKAKNKSESKPTEMTGVLPLAAKR